MRFSPGQAFVPGDDERSECLTCRVHATRIWADSVRVRRLDHDTDVARKGFEQGYSRRNDVANTGLVVSSGAPLELSRIAARLRGHRCKYIPWRLCRRSRKDTLATVTADTSPGRREDDGRPSNPTAVR